MKVKTLTPLWTGGVGGKVDRIHETGLLGSMRWWYEVLVRGLGGRVCERSDECKFDVDKYFKSEASDEGKRLRDAGLCDVCQVFGATGWKRRFRLSVKESEIYDAIIQHPIEAERVYETQGKNIRQPGTSQVFPTLNLIRLKVEASRSRSKVYMVIFHLM